MSTPSTELTKQSADNALIALIATAAQDQSIDVSKLQQLVELRERILAHEAEIAFNQAMSAAQSEMQPILRDAENPHAHSRYATLEKVDREVRPIYTKNGFCLTFNTAEPRNPNSVRVVCDVRHVAGHKKEYFLEGDLDVSGSQGKSNKTSIQGLGSSTSYLRRYLTLMIFNLTLTNEDNDGCATGSKAAQKEVLDRQLREVRDSQARRAAARATQEPVYEAIPEEPMPSEDEIPSKLELELKASLELAEQNRSKKAKDNSYSQMLEAFAALKKKYVSINMEDRYSDVLRQYGVEHSNQFATMGQARKCFAFMRLDVADCEVMEHDSKQTESLGG